MLINIDLVSQKGIIFLRFEPATLQSAVQQLNLSATEGTELKRSAIQWLSLLAIGDDGQKGITFQRFEPATLQTKVQWLNLSAMEGTHPE